MVDYNNSYGAVMIADGGTPRIITIKARADISGGYWVNGSSAQGVVSSGADSYVSLDIEGFPVATQVGSQVIGLALQTIPSGTYGPIAMRGIFLLPLASGTGTGIYGGSILAGQPILAGSAGTVVALVSGTVITTPGAAAGAWLIPAGRALTEATPGQFVAVSLNI